MTVVVKTLREFLLGTLSDFADSTALAEIGTPSHLASLIVALAHYQEEGLSLVPEVFLCKGIDEIIQMLPGAERVQVGTRAGGAEAIEEALKRCAPLARNGWCIYVEKPAAEYRFGVFRGSLNPTAISVDRTLFTEAMPTVPMIRLHRIANGCVALINHRAEAHHLMLSEKSGIHWTSSTDAPAKLIRAACAGLKDEYRETVKTYLERVVKLGLIESHGSLIVVSSSERVPNFLSDGVALQPSIDIAKGVQQRLKSAESDDYRLEGIASLLRGMLGSDGIVVFSRTAKLLAYRCFIRVPEKTGTAMNGGARSRAYAALTEKLGNGLVAVFAQSQDGWIKFEEKSHGR